MSKLIVEMEMPKNCCVDCEISIDGFACKKARTNGGKCPIVGVLPDEHGDLIDRDDLMKECYPDDEYDLFVVDVGDVLNAKVVIAAERKDNEQIH
jgi:hypothetical protein